MLNIGIHGCGRIGQVHAQTISRLEAARVIAVADAVAEAAHALAARTGAQVMEAQALIDSRLVDAVIIATPTDAISTCSMPQPAPASRFSAKSRWICRPTASATASRWSTPQAFRL